MSIAAEQASFYRLLRLRGRKVIIHLPARTEVDVESGRIDQMTEDYTIPRALVYNTKSQGKFIYDIAFLAANKNFTYGADFQQGYVAVAFMLKEFKRIFNIEGLTGEWYHGGTVETDNGQFEIQTAYIQEEAGAIKLVCKSALGVKLDD